MLGARRYTASELSGSRPAELTVAEDWVRAPQTPGQQMHLESEAVYRGFVYDSYTAVSDTIAPMLDRLFWEDYDDSNDGIYSAVSRVREVLRDEMTYTETPSEAPGGENPLTWFLTGGARAMRCSMPPRPLWRCARTAFRRATARVIC